MYVHARTLQCTPLMLGISIAMSYSVQCASTWDDNDNAHMHLWNFLHKVQLCAPLELFTQVSVALDDSFATETEPEEADLHAGTHGFVQSRKTTQQSWHLRR